MAVSTNPLQRDRVGVQAQDTGDRLQGPSSNAALQLAHSLRDLEPTLDDALTGYAQKEAEEKRAQGRRDALIGQGQTLADAVRAGKLQPTQNPWYMEAYAKESGAIRAQKDFADLQLQSTTWAEQTDPQAFAQKWHDGVAGIAKNYSGKDELAGFAPVEAQFTQQTLQSNTAQNQQRIVTERKQNVSGLAAQALQSAASRGGGTLSGSDAVTALAPSKQMWLATGGSLEDWNTIQVQAITSAAYGSQNPGLLDLTKAIGLDGATVLDGKFGAGADPAPTVHPIEVPASRFAPTPEAVAAAPEKFRLPVANARFTDGFGKRRATGEVHNGLDLAVPEGTPVASPGAGKVVAVGWDPNGGGNFVKVDYGNGLTSSFAHLSRQDVKVGDQVGAGAQVGLSGQTGNAHGAHVHWVVRQGSQAINPLSAKFPQGGSAVEAAAAQAQGQPVAAEAVPPAQASPAAAPQPVASGPSLYDIAGVADSAEKDRYDITRSQEDALTRSLQTRKVAIQTRAQEATDYLYQQHGTDILLGNYKTPALISELAGKGYSGPEIQETLKELSSATSASAEMSHNSMALHGDDPQQARKIMDLSLEGRKNGYSPGYENRVGDAVLSGQVSGTEGERMVAESLSRTNQQKAEDRADAREQRAEQNAQPGVIHSYTQLRQRGDDLEATAAQAYTLKTLRPPSQQERQKIKGIVTDAMRGHLSGAPGDWNGAIQAGRDAVASYANHVRQPGALLMAPSGSNPRPH